MARRGIRMFFMLLIGLIQYGCARSLATDSSASTQPAGGGDGDSRVGVIAISFESSEGHGFDGEILVPAERKSNQYGVLLIGGGLATDRNWTLPGVFTISGQETRDGLRLAESLADRGYTVMRWDAFRRDDPLRAKDPTLVTVSPYPQTMLQAQLALKAFRDRKVVPDDRIFLIGHSLGAKRAFHIVENDSTIAGVINLAGADLAQTDWDRMDLRRVAGSSLAEMDWSGDGVASSDEFERWKSNGAESPLVTYDFTGLDRDADEVLRRWEIEAEIALRDRKGLFTAGAVTRDRYGLSFAEDILHRHPVPVLNLYGALDGLCFQGVLFYERLKSSGRTDFDFHVLPDLGHNMGHEDRGKTGPVSDEVIQRVGDWMDAVRRQRASAS